MLLYIKTLCSYYKIWGSYFFKTFQSAHLLCVNIFDFKALLKNDIGNLKKNLKNLEGMITKNL